MWPADEFAEAAGEALASRARALDEEQAVHGLDALEELGFHPLLAAAFGTPEHACLREVAYPSEPDSRTKIERMNEEALRAIADPVTGEIATPDVSDPTRSERQRCDLVVLPAGTTGLVDPIVVRKQARAERAKVARTLFESIAPPADAPEPGPGRALAQPGEALWLEVKVIGQYCYTHGVGGPNRAYAPELTRNTVADLRKLVRDPLIEHAALVLVLFSADEATARHDLAAFTHRCLDKGLSVSAPVVRGFDLADRIGNRRANVAVVRVRR
jgi:hypothetical protein